MALFSPVRSQCQFDTPGERRFAERLETAGRRLPLLEQRPGRLQGALSRLRRAVPAARYLLSLRTGCYPLSRTGYLWL